jgi:transposase InsO family protein
MINDLQNQTQASNREISDTLGLGYRTLLRWRKRVSGGKPPLTPPGPKKTGPLPLEEVRRDIEALRHGPKRSQGSCALQARYTQSISRRAVADMVAEVRSRKARERRQVSKRVTWKEPNLAWAIDGTERGQDGQGDRLHVHAVQDLCTRYRLEPLVATESKGEAVALHLEKLFQKHGPPLFLKRDNGSSLNHAAVDRVLADYGVIPLNSPAYYPKYNGSIEKGIREMKTALGECLPQAVTWQPEAIRPYILAVHHELNCRPRRSLQGHTACEAYRHLPRHRYKQRQRHAIFGWIRIRANDSIQQLEKIDHRSLNAAWRHAAEAWLRCQGLITVSINKKVLPNYPLKCAYN